MEQIHGQTAGFVVISENVRIVVLLGGGDSLLFLELVNRGELIAEASGRFKLLGFSSRDHAGGKIAFELGVAAFEEQLRIADGIGIRLRRGEAFDAGPETTMNVVLEA